MIKLIQTYSAEFKLNKTYSNLFCRIQTEYLYIPEALMPTVSAGRRHPKLIQTYSAGFKLNMEIFKLNQIYSAGSKPNISIFKLILQDSNSI